MMLKPVTGLALLLLSGTTFAPAPPERGPVLDDDSVVVVRMIEKSATNYAFEPADIQVRQGSVVRFVQDGAVPHNVEFDDTPAGADLDKVRMGPFLMQKGETYEVSIDDRFTEGEYRFVCTPHEAMGMTGSLTVTSGR